MYNSKINIDFLVSAHAFFFTFLHFSGCLGSIVAQKLEKTTNHMIYYTIH